MTLRIANAAGFLGDSLDAPRRLIEAVEVDFLTLEYLAELTLSILARQREKNPQAGFAGDFLEVLSDICDPLRKQKQLRVVTNAGGMNPLSCAKAASKILIENGLGKTLIATVSGDDLLPHLEILQADGCRFEHLDTGEPLLSLGKEIVSANAYLGAAPIVEALDQNARIVITGRVADASLTLGPAVQHFGWNWKDWNRLAAGSVAGHMIECGAQVTGGYSVDWKDRNLTDVGYPIVELDAQGDCVVTKPDGSGGVVSRQTVVEQLIYEIGDPAHYLTPDVDVDFTTVEVEQVGTNRVAVRATSGQAPPDTYKVSLAYRDGYTASGQLLVYGRDCLDKAKACGEMILQRVARSGFDLENTHVEFLGAGNSATGKTKKPPLELREVVLRVSVHDARREAVERFTKEIAPLITSGPAGLAGYASGRSRVRGVYAYWPTTVAKEFVHSIATVQTANAWLSKQG